jgi:hypothetical protein
MQDDDLHLLGIPRSRSIIAKIYPHHDAYSRLPHLGRLGTCCMHQCSTRAAQDIKGITDLLLPQTSMCLSSHSPSKKAIPM